MNGIDKIIFHDDNVCTWTRDGWGHTYVNVIVQSVLLNHRNEFVAARCSQLDTYSAFSSPYKNMIKACFEI